MSGLFARLGRFLTKSKNYVGKDLEGNRFYELPPANGGRTKRVVEYRVQRDIADYTSGTQRLPVQWTTWLSHTRADPPSLSELQADADRRRDLLPKISAIEQREREERIRQGYLVEDGSGADVNGQRPRAIAGPSSMRAAAGGAAGPSSTAPVRGASGRMSTRPSFSEATAEISSRPSIASAPFRGAAAAPQEPQQPHQPQPQPQLQQQQQQAVQPGNAGHRPPHARDGLDLPVSSTAYPVPTPTFADVAPSRDTVDPVQHNSADELRRLSMEDTQRRIEESRAKVDVPAGATEGTQGAVSGGLKPRRRGKA